MPRLVLCPRRSLRDWKWIAPVVFAAVLAAAALAAPVAAYARGGGAYIRQMQQIMRQQQQEQKKLMEAIQKQEEADYKAFMERFDTNRDGKISGKERGPVTKYLREKELGLDPDAAIKKQQKATMRLGKKKASKSKSAKTKSAKE